MSNRRPYAEWEVHKIISMFNAGYPMQEILKTLDHRTMSSLREKVLFLRNRGRVGYYNEISIEAKKKKREKNERFKIRI